MTLRKNSFTVSLQGAPDQDQRQPKQPEDAESQRAEARRKYLERIEKEKLAQEQKLEAERRMAEARLKEEAHARFMRANPQASEADFHSCWLSILEELSRQRSQKILEEMRRNAIKRARYIFRRNAESDSSALNGEFPGSAGGHIA
ncbi:MAG TPA: hypothetical protein VKC34_03460 [Blastocatellia bacterium]|nr:hypothetical protein [Blastocatellia bacterium]